uniref:EGF-like domain-containing protein n=1 Tax=Syphacia muris TaxID=451379 RepID=A0A0N5AR73_9BILA
MPFVAAQKFTPFCLYVIDCRLICTVLLKPYTSYLLADYQTNNIQKKDVQIEERSENCFLTTTKACFCVAPDNSIHEARNPESCRSERRKRATTTPDPVVEKARAGHSAVIQELKEKFAGLKEGCYPRVKGCLCVIGKDRDGRDITERRMKDADCKCKPGERGKGCPAA